MGSPEHDLAKPTSLPTAVLAAGRYCAVGTDIVWTLDAVYD